MKLAGKLAALTLAVATVPLAVAGYTLERLSRRALERSVVGSQRATANSVAQRISDELGAIERQLIHAPRLLARGSAEGEVLVGLSRVVYHGHEGIAAVWLLDERGEELVPPQFLPDPASAPGLEAHEATSAEDVARRREAIPFEDARRRGRALVVVTETARPAHLIFAHQIVVEGSAGARTLVLAADVTLAGFGKLVGRHGDGAVALVTGGTGGEVICAGELAGAAEQERVRNDALVVSTPLTVAVTARRAVVFASVSDLRLRSLYWLAVAVILATLFAVVFGRELGKRARRLAQNCASIARGNFAERVPVTTNDEISELAASFNQMAADLERQNDEIQKKNQEITTWNRELEARVAEKSRELAAAQDLLLRSRNLAAIGTLGAGMAHEINNPLTGVLGLSQILSGDLPADDPKQELVKDIEQQALRIQKIVAGLLELSRWEDGTELLALDLNQVVEESVQLIGPNDPGRNQVVIEKRLAQGLPHIRGNPVQLQKALVELIDNARRAMPKGGTIHVETMPLDKGAVVLRVQDTGGGIKEEYLGKIFDPFFTTKQNWTSTGMGLTMVHKIVEEHHGTIVVKSTWGEGTTFTLTFPADPGRTHLD